MDVAVQDIEKQRAIDNRYLSMASIWATNSYCKRLSVGALIVKDKILENNINNYQFIQY